MAEVYEDTRVNAKASKEALLPRTRFVTSLACLDCVQFRAVGLVIPMKEQQPDNDE
jgi:hypothetical protein